MATLFIVAPELSDDEEVKIWRVKVNKRSIVYRSVEISCGCLAGVMDVRVYLAILLIEVLLHVGKLIEKLLTKLLS